MKGKTCLINNAGAVFGSRMVTEDGLEVTFALNHLAYFQLTNLLLDVLKASAPSRIINVSSMAHKQGNIHFDDLQMEKKYGGNRAYSQSKLTNILFTYELSSRLQGTGVTANCMNPGMVATNFARDHTPLWVRILIRGLLRPFAMSPAKGAETVIYLASSQDTEGITGKYFEKLKPIKSSELSYDESLASRLWRVSSQLMNLAPNRLVRTTATKER